MKDNRHTDHHLVKYKRKWILLIFLEFLQNDIYLNKNHQFWPNLRSQKPQLYTNITKIVNITANEDSFTLWTIVRDLAHNILLAIKRNNTSFTLFLIVSCSQHMYKYVEFDKTGLIFENVRIIVTKKCPLFFKRKKDEGRQIKLIRFLRDFEMLRNTVGNLDSAYSWRNLDFWQVTVNGSTNELNSVLIRMFGLIFHKIFFGQNCKPSLCDIFHHKASLLNQLKPRNETF